jgi:uncharacterized protein (DUF2252 family)
MTLPLTLEQRFALGRQRRKQLPRTGHATWTHKNRREDPSKLLQASARGRVPALIALKNQRMALSPFAYFRGAVPVMAYDLSLIPNTGIDNQLCGDAHIRNLGAFAAPDGSLVFDINDFDETISGPFEWDVKRMATSLILVGREAGAKNSQCQESAAVFLDHYCRIIQNLSRRPVLDLAHYQVHRLNDISTIAGILHLAERATPIHNLLTLTEKSPRPAGKPPIKQSNTLTKSKTVAPAPEPPPITTRHFRTIDPTLTPLTGNVARSVLDSLPTYAESLLPERRHFLAQYTPIDVAFKVVGTGSVGLRDYCVYMQGNGTKDPLFIQIKEEALSAYAPYLGQTAATAYHQGRRVVEGARALQFQSDPFLGWTTIDGRDYLVRQLNDHKASVNLADLRSASLLEYAGVCGELLGRSHARAGDSAILAGYIGGSGRFDTAILAFAEAYADQTDLDWKRHVRSLKTAPAKAPKPAKNSVPKKNSKPNPKPKTKSKGK